MLTGIHILLTYTCHYECDHCFLYCGPHSEGTFTLDQLRQLLHQAVQLRTVDSIYFEGGEPFLFYPLLLEGVKLARGMGFKAGIVTNAYWATSVEDAGQWLAPLAQLGIFDLSVSDDLFHHDKPEESPVKNAVAAASKLHIPVNAICIEKPTAVPTESGDVEKGSPVTGGEVMYKGRAVEKLTSGQPTRGWRLFTECPHEDLRDPSRVHIDAYGHVHLCQGLLMGNMWKTPLASLVANYDPLAHPICGPLIKGGPAQLAREYNVEHDKQYVDACHLCFVVRSALLEKFPDYLAPRQVYGLSE
ncbi:MAG TPA: hypothetical protein VN285_01500 [Candidatus Deferrimicrobium sp.]|nr:hypothetical protein [Candidatus Deferrimicrobium sp.]